MKVNGEKGGFGLDIYVYCYIVLRMNRISSMVEFIRILCKMFCFFCFSFLWLVCIFIFMFFVLWFLFGLLNWCSVLFIGCCCLGWWWCVLVLVCFFFYIGGFFVDVCLGVFCIFLGVVWGVVGWVFYNCFLCVVLVFLVCVLCVVFVCYKGYGKYWWFLGLCWWF